MEELSLHILDIAENSISAGAKNIEIKITENKESDLLKIEIIDDGKGMSEEERNRTLDPFFTSRTTRRVGLGLPMLYQASKLANGTMDIRSNVGKGTYVSATFQLGHIDRQPLGNMAQTITALIASNPNVDVMYEYNRNGNKFVFNTKEIKAKLASVNINTSGILSFINKFITENTESLS